MSDAAQTALTVGMPTLAVLVGILVNNSRLGDVNSRIDELRVHVDKWIDDLKDTLRADLLRVEQVMDARLRHLEENR